MALPFQSAAIVATQRSTNLAYIPTLTRSAVAPPGSVPAGTICVSPTGSASGDGTPANPYDLTTGNANLTDGGTLLLLDGIYTLAESPTVTFLGKEGQTLQTTVKAQTSARPILTTASGTPPNLRLQPRTTFDGVWCGGGRTATETVITHGNDCIVQNCTFFNYYSAIAEGSATRDQYLSNRFVNCGTGSLYHDIYISNMNAAVGEGAVIRGNIHVGGEGYKIHLWHEPKYTTVQRNFCHTGVYGMVIDGDGHTVDHNIIWRHWLWGEESSNTAFSKNIVGPLAEYGTQSVLGPGTTRDGNISVAPAALWGTNPVQWTQADWQANTGYSVAQVDDTVSNLISAFSESTGTIQADNSIEPLFAILAAVRDAVAGLGLQQAIQAEAARTSRRRGGPPLSHRHKGGRNRLGVTRSRRLTTR